MALNKPSRVKVPVGMRTSHFYPISSEPSKARPVYGKKRDMGAAVLGRLSVVTVSGQIPGDDINQVDIEKFVSGQLDAETTMSDLEVNAVIFGHKYTEAEGEISAADDAAPSGGYSYIEPIMLKDKSTIYRATALLKVSAISSAEKQESDTKKPGELSFKNYAVSYKISECATGEWRLRKEFPSEDEACTWLDTIFGQDNLAAAAIGGDQQSN